LSPRETEILALLATGRGTRWVARHLGITVSTIDSHILTMRRKLGVPSTVALQAYACRRALLQDLQPFLPVEMWPRLLVLALQPILTAHQPPEGTSETGTRNAHM